MFKRTKKVKVAVFGRDLVVHVGKYEVSSKASKIKIRTGGKRNFNPSFTETSHLMMPKGFGRKERVYFVRNGATACIDFKTKDPEIKGADQSQVVEAAEAELIRNFGKEAKDTPWFAYVTMALQFIIIVILLQ